MTASTETSPSTTTTASTTTTLSPVPPVLQVDFSWGKSQALISEKTISPTSSPSNSPSSSKHTPPGKPVYLVDSHLFAPHLVFKTASDNTTFGTATLHALSINSNCTVHGRESDLKAMSRLKTEYTHLSYAYSLDGGKTPVNMTWSGSCSLKKWDFECKDPEGEVVARFRSNVWAVKKLGDVEFFGERGGEEAVRDEIVATGLTLYLTMLVRTSSIVSLMAAVFARPEKLEKGHGAVVDEKGEGKIVLGSEGSGEKEKVVAVEEVKKI